MRNKIRKSREWDSNKNIIIYVVRIMRGSHGKFESFINLRCFQMISKDDLQQLFKFKYKYYANNLPYKSQFLLRIVPTQDTESVFIYFIFYFNYL